MASEQPNEASIFNAARKLESAAERNAFLTEACRASDGLRERVEKLLGAFAEESQYLEQPAPGLQATVLTGPDGSDRAASLEAGLAAAFDEEKAVVLGDGNHSVLKMLGQTLDQVPRVALRESTVEGRDPIVRPKSDEMPDRNSDSRYQLQGEIARGGMGAILKGRDTDLGRDLAIKVLLDAHKNKPDVIQRFVEEAQIGGQLQHPGIAPIYELGQFKDKRPFFAMKLVKGETLSKLLADREDAADERGKFIGIFEQICQTMAYAHSRGVIHRDLKPANIMVGAFGEVQVMDWGLAKVLQAGGVADEKKSQLQQGQSIIATLRSGVGSDSPGVIGSVGSHTQMGSVMGTPAYMPPEQALGEIDQMDERADVFGLGAILCEILTGQPPYVGTDGTAVYRQASRGKLDDCMARLDACGADEDLIALTKHCLELEPRDRPRDASVLAERVTGYLESVETKLRETEVERATQAARAIEARKRMRVTMALAATVLLSLGIGGAGWRWMELQAIERREVATTKVNSSLSDAQLHQNLADSVELETQVAELDKAVASAQQAVELASSENVEASLISRATTLLADLESRANSVRQRAEQSRKDQEFKTELELIRLSQSDGVAVTVALGSQVETLKAKIVVVDTQANDEIPEGIEPDADSDPDASEKTPDAGPEDSQGDEPEAVPAQETAVAQVFDFSSALERYEEAFRNAGIDMRVLPVPEAAALVRSSAIQETLIGAIDNWARGLDEKKSSLEDNPSSDTVAGLSRAKLLAIANAADNSVWRRTVRAALERNDTAQLKELAEAEEVRRQSPELIAWLGAALRDGEAVDRSIAVLLESQRNHPGDFWLNYELGKSYVRQGQHLEGLGFARTALGIRPESPGAMIALAVASSETGRHADEMSLYRALLAKNPRLYDAHAGLGLAATQMAEWETAIAAYRTAIELKPGNGELYGALALALRSARRYGEAVDVARKGVDVDPGNAQAHIYLGRVLQGLRLGGITQSEAARAAYQKAIELEPKNARAYYYLGYLKSHYFRNDGGIDELRTAIQLDPQFAEAHATLGAVLFSEKKFDESLAACEKAIEIAPNSSPGYRTSIPPLLELGRNSHAVANGRRAIVLNPQDGQAHAWLGEALRRQGNLKEAIELQRHAVELEPDNWWVVAKLAESLKAQGISDSLAIHTQILEWVPESTAAAIALSETFQNQNVPADLSRIRELIDKNLKNSQLLNGTAWWLVTHRDEQGHFQHIDDAVRWAKTACELEPESGAILNTLGVAYYRHGQWQTAIDTLQKSQTQNRGELSDALFLAMAYQQLGERPQSLDHYAQALTLRGANTFDSETESFFSEARRLLDPQREDLEKLLARDPDNAGVTREFADLLLAFSDKEWTVLEPTETKSEGGTTLTKLDDNSILASGENPNGDVYTVVTRSPATGISSLRLEALTHESLPNQGPGRQQRDAGNFGMIQFDVSHQKQEGTAQPLVLDNATSDYTHRPITLKGWNCAGGGSKPHTAIYSLQHPLETVTDGRIHFQMRFSANPVWPGGNLGRFRLSISDDPNAYVNAERRFAAMKLTDPWTKLAAAYHLFGDQQAFDKLLEQHPQAASLELVGFLAESGKSLLAEQRNNEALSQLLKARELFSSIARQHPASEWTVLQPTTMTSQGGATLTRLEDGSILASGKNPDQDAYEITANGAPPHIKAIRLEAIPDPSLPQRGPGRHPGNGNFHLNEFRVVLNGMPHKPAGIIVSYGEGNREKIMDGTVEANHWSIHPRSGQQHSAVFATDLAIGADDTLTLELVSSRANYPQHNLGRFRFSVTSDPHAIEAARFHQRLKESDLAGLEVSLGNAYGQLGMVDDAATAFIRALDLTDERDTRIKVVQAATAFGGVLNKLAALRHQDAAFHDALARHYQTRGEFVAARAAVATARTLYEQQRASDSENTSLALQLADLLLLDAEMATTWTILKPTEMKSEGGATLTKLDDNSILAGGENPLGDAYTIITRSSGNSVNAIRLEALTHESLPNQGPGRQQRDAGKFGMIQFEVSHQEQDGTAQPLVLDNATSDHASTPITMKEWYSAGGGSKPHTAVYSLQPPLEAVTDGRIQFQMRFRANPDWPGSNLGRFRLSVSDDPNAYANAEGRFAALRITDPWAKLAAAYHLVGDQQQLDKLLALHPEAKSAVDSLKSLSWLRDLRASGLAIKSSQQLPDGTWELDLEGATITDLAILKGPPISRLSLKKTAVSDLTPLHGMPLKHLNLEGTSVTDLTPLQEMPLEELVLTGLPISDLKALSGLPISKLWLGNTTASDLTPLRGMPLKLLQLFNTRVADLSPLNGMPLDYLHVSGTKVTDLAALRGMPLTGLRLHGCTELTDVSPLADCKELKQVTLPPNAKDIAFLRTLPKLERLSFKEDNRPGFYSPDKTAEEFWTDYEAKIKLPSIKELNQAIAKEPTNTTLLAQRAEHHFAAKQWELARADWLRAVEQQPNLTESVFQRFEHASRFHDAAAFGLPLLKQKPEDSYRWLQVAPVMALSDDEADYAAFCHWIVQQPARTAEIAERAIKACLLRAGGIDLATLPTEALTKPLDEGNTPKGFQPWGWSARALLAYRSGDAESAVKYLTRSEELQPVDYNHAMNLSVLALAQQKLNHPEAARQALGQARQLITQLQADETKKYSNNLRIAEILFHEAEAQLNGPKTNSK